MKKVFSSPYDVAHMFATRTQTEARTSSNSVYFYNDVIYSYGKHFPIATFSEDSKGNEIVLFTLREYSVTTAKHKQQTRTALNHFNIVYCENPTAKTKEEHLKNVEFWIKEILSIGSKLPTARKPEKYINLINEEKRQLEIYLNTFNLKLSKKQKEQIDIKDRESYLVVNEKQIKAKKQRELKAKKELKARLIREQKEHLENVEKWKNNEKIYIPYYEKRSTDYLRVNKDNNIETSQRVILTTEEAKRIYLALKNKTELSTINDVNNTNFKFNSYDNEFLIVGCHKINKTEIDYVANKLKF